MLKCPQIISSQWLHPQTSSLQMVGKMPPLVPGLHHLLASKPSREKENPLSPSIYINLWKYPSPLGSYALPDSSLSPGILSNLTGQPKSSLTSSPQWERQGYMIDRPFPKAKDAEQTKIINLHLILSRDISVQWIYTQTYLHHSLARACYLTPVDLIFSHLYATCRAGGHLCKKALCSYFLSSLMSVSVLGW